MIEDKVVMGWMVGIGKLALARLAATAYHQTMTGLVSRFPVPGGFPVPGAHARDSQTDGIKTADSRNLRI